MIVLHTIDSTARTDLMLHWLRCFLALESLDPLTILTHVNDWLKYGWVRNLKFVHYQFSAEDLSTYFSADGIVKAKNS